MPFGPFHACRADAGPIRTGWIAMLEGVNPTQDARKMLDDVELAPGSPFQRSIRRASTPDRRFASMVAAA